jgi:aminoglycoside phosphotransferase (APT) family kinase protein
MALPQTLVHGEFYGSNVLIASTTNGLRICPVDWELAARGPALLDLASLTVGRWSDDERDRLTQVYLDESACARSRAEALQDLECCRLHVAVQWLGWTEGWTPPPEHENNWLAEAVRAARQIGIL